MALGPTPFPNLAHLVIGFSGTPITSEKDFVPFCVLQSLMGGGGSFSLVFLKWRLSYLKHLIIR